MLPQTEHVVERHARVMASAFVHGDAVHDVSSSQIFERPEQMYGRDAEHCRTNADAGVERHYFAVSQLFAKTVDEVNLRADGPLGAGGRRSDGLDDAFGRADMVGRV